MCPFIKMGSNPTFWIFQIPKTNMNYNIKIHQSEDENIVQTIIKFIPSPSIQLNYSICYINVQLDY